MHITLALWAGCTQPEAQDPPDTDGTTDTGTVPQDTADTDTGTLPVGTASCALAPNATVISCTTTLPAEGPATLILSAEGLPTRTFESGEHALEHQLWGWGLLPETTYDWSFGGVEGTITTGALPPELSDVEIEVTGTLFGMDAVFVYLDCGFFAMVDGQGRILWAQRSTVYDSLPDGMMWSPETLSVLELDDSTMSPTASEFLETHISGAEMMRLEPGDFQFNLTHDIGRWGPYTYLLAESDHIGAFEVFEGETRVGSVVLSDYYAGFPGLSMAHVNGLVLTEDGEAVMSLFAFNAAIGIDADPTSPTFGELLWLASGAPGFGQDLPDPDYLPAEGTGFERQHNASRHGDSLWVFDNMSQPTSRALQLQLDEATGVMTEVGSWSMGQICTAQGGAVPVEGGVLATCATQSLIYAFQEASTEPDWTLHASCHPKEPQTLITAGTRGFPVTIK